MERFFLFDFDCTCDTDFVEFIKFLKQYEGAPIAVIIKTLLSGAFSLEKLVYIFWLP